MLKEHCSFLIVFLTESFLKGSTEETKGVNSGDHRLWMTPRKGEQMQSYTWVLCFISRSWAWSSPSITLWGHLLFAHFFLQWMSYNICIPLWFCLILFQRIWLVGKSHRTIIALKYKHFLPLLDGRTQVQDRHTLLATTQCLSSFF